MATSLEHRISCKYLVARYIGDEVRNEPINIGIILQSQKDYTTSARFITKFDKIRTASEDSEFLQHILGKIYQEMQYSKEKNVLDKIFKRYEGKIRFTEPRGTLAINLENEINDLYQRYVSVEEQPISRTSIKMHRYQIIRLPDLRKNVWSYLKAKFAKNVKKNYPIKGKESKFKYDFAILNVKRFFHSISFDSNYSLKNTKLFDWHVMDALAMRGLKQENFGAIISEPSVNNPRYEKIREPFREGMRILKDRNYNLVTYDEFGRWKKKIEELA